MLAPKSEGLRPPPAETAATPTAHTRTPRIATQPGAARAAAKPQRPAAATAQLHQRTTHALRALLVGASPMPPV
eukprot:366546-Chlamydomonas_euryale.AAC.29